MSITADKIVAGAQAARSGGDVGSAILGDSGQSPGVRVVGDEESVSTGDEARDPLLPAGLQSDSLADETSEDDEGRDSDGQANVDSEDSTQKAARTPDKGTKRRIAVDKGKEIGRAHV